MGVFFVGCVGGCGAGVELSKTISKSFILRRGKVYQSIIPQLSAIYSSVIEGSSENKNKVVARIHFWQNKLSCIGIGTYGQRMMVLSFTASCWTSARKPTFQTHSLALIRKLVLVAFSSLKS